MKTNPIECKAAILHTIGADLPYAKSTPIKIENIKISPPGKNEVLVKVKYASLCHSDLSVINGSRPRPVPMALGHEGSGVIVQLGDDVDNFAVDDHIVFVFVPSCGKCLSCLEGKPSLCDPGLESNVNGTLLSGEKKIFLNGKAINHHVGVSCFSQYVVVSTKSIVKVDKGISLSEAALFGCAVITGAGAVFNTAKIRPGSSTAVIGLGGTGLAAIMGSKASGASTIIGVDIIDEKLELAKNLGATHVINAKEKNVINQIKSISSSGVQYSFECAGSEKTMELAYSILKRGGTAVSSGLPHPSKKIGIPHVDLVAHEKSVKGSFLGSCVPTRDIPAYIEMYKNGNLPVDKLISKNISLQEINQGFDDLNSGETVRQIITL